MEEREVILQDGWCVTLWIDGDKEGLNLCGYFFWQAVQDGRYFPKLGWADGRAIGKAEIDQFIAILEVLVGAGLSCVIGQGIGASDRAACDGIFGRVKVCLIQVHDQAACA